MPVSIKDVEGTRFVKVYAAYLKRSNTIEVPAFASFVKSGTHVELAPMENDWYYIRAASIARQVYLNNGIGVGALRHYYGGSINRGVKPSVHRAAAGGIIRHILQQLEAKNIIASRAGHGRVITPHGQSDMDRIAAVVKRS